MSKYIRTAIQNFFELSEEQQKKQRAELDHLEQEELEQENFVSDPCDENEVIPLSMFLRSGYPNLENKKYLFDGVYGQSYFSAYFIKIGRDGETCTVAYRHC